MNDAPWYAVLLAARRVAKSRGDGLFTPPEVGLEAGIRPSERSSTGAIASAWCAKLVRWGYARRAGKEATMGRPVTVYLITRWGLRFRPASSAKVAANPKRPR